jgi:hypothetical protein
MASYRSYKKVTGSQVVDGAVDAGLETIIAQNGLGVIPADVQQVAVAYGLLLVKLEI